MVIGVDRFRSHFASHEHQYVLIGGAACELIMDEVGLDFRATKDLDIVLGYNNAYFGTDLAENATMVTSNKMKIDTSVMN